MVEHLTMRSDATYFTHTSPEWRTNAQTSFGCEHHVDRPLPSVNLWHRVTPSNSKVYVSVSCWDAGTRYELTRVWPGSGCSSALPAASAFGAAPLFFLFVSSQASWQNDSIKKRCVTDPY